MALAWVNNNKYNKSRRSLETVVSVASAHPLQRVMPSPPRGLYRTSKRPRRGAPKIKMRLRIITEAKSVLVYRFIYAAGAGLGLGEGFEFMGAWYCLYEYATVS